MKVLPEKAKEERGSQNIEKPSIASPQPASSFLPETSGGKPINDDINTGVDDEVPLNEDNISKTGDASSSEDHVSIEEIFAPQQQINQQNENVPVNEVDATTNKDNTPVIDPRNEADVSDDEDEVTFPETPANLSNKSKMSALHAVLGETGAALQVDLPGRPGPSAGSGGLNDESEAPVVNLKKRRFVNSKETLVKDGRKKKRFASLPDPIALGPPMPDHRRSTSQPQTRFYVEGEFCFSLIKMPLNFSLLNLNFL